MGTELLERAQVSPERLPVKRKSEFSHPCSLMVKSGEHTQPLVESRLRGVTVLSLFKGPMKPMGLDRLLDRAGLAVRSHEDAICDVLSCTVSGPRHQQRCM